jgi:predicted nucleic acid-binding protein
MRFVLDASITVTWAMRDEDHPLADRAFSEIQADSAMVPCIWWYEVRNILVVNERRNRISQEDVARFLQAIGQFSIDIDSPDDDTSTMNLSRKHRLTVYDAAYLALAIRERLPLATLDKYLQEAAQSAGVALLS